MALADPRSLDNADYITVKAKPGYSETFLKNDLSSTVSRKRSKPPSISWPRAWAGPPEF
ncbi:MAG: hypothetical protein WCF90_09935 [Methanomicrobiales archaeon]